jgi:steroid delta-isomerase-like uncharacterized protein
MAIDYKAIARRIVEEAWSKGNLGIVDEVVSPSYVDHDPSAPAPVRGLDGAKEQVKLYRTAFPDLTFTIDDMMVDGEKVLTRWTARGTHKGSLMGIPPTGKQATVTGMTIDRFSGGKIVEGWANWDTLGLLQQLGVIPKMG